MSKTTFVCTIPDDDIIDCDGALIMRDGFPYSGALVDLLTGEDNIIINRILRTRRATRHRGASSFIYVPNSGCWCHARSAASIKYISGVLEHKNVSVNYHGSSLPYRDMIDRYAQHVSDVPRSICIGTYRLNFRILEYKTIFSTVHGVLPLQPSESDDITDPIEFITSGFCFMPLYLQIIPASLPNDTMSVAERILSVTIDRMSLDVFMWCIRNSLQDPVMTPRLLFLYGDGGEGKSVALSTITSNLPGIVGILTQDYIGRRITRIEETDMGRMMSSRFVCYGDVCLNERKQINESFMTIMSGNDSVSTTTMTGKLQCAGLFAMNTLWNPYKSITKAWFARRVVCITVKAAPKGLKKSTKSFTDDEILCFVHQCLLIYNRSSCIPMTSKMALRSLFGDRTGSYCRGVFFDDNASYMMSLIATYSISNISGLGMHKLLLLIRQMCPTLLREPDDDYELDIQKNWYAIAIRGLAAVLTEYSKDSGENSV